MSSSGRSHHREEWRRLIRGQAVFLLPVFIFFGFTPFARGEAGEGESRGLYPLAKLAHALDLNPEELEVVAIRQGLRSRHVHLRQLFSGIPVLGSVVSLHLGGDGQVKLVRKRIFQGLQKPPARKIHPSQAEEISRAAWGIERDALETSSMDLFVQPLGRGSRLVYECWLYPVAPPGSLRIQVDATTGKLLEMEDCRQFFDGLGRVFLPNPVVALQDDSLRDQDDAADAVPGSAYIEVPLRDLSGSGAAGDPYLLTGPYVTTEGTPDRASSLSGEFLFDRSHPWFEEVMVYYHIDSFQRRIQALGFSDVCHRRIRVYVNSEPPGIPFPADKSYYSPDGKGTGFLVFGTGGVDSAEDAEIIAHEYGHAVLDNQVPNFGKSREAGPLKEGFCDFFAAAILSVASNGFGDACFAEWKASTYSSGPPFCLRRLDTAKRYPYDMTYSDRYQDSEIWSGALWNLAGALGADKALQLALEGNFALAPDAKFPHAGEALLLADRELFDGENRQVIEAVLKARGILRPPIRLEGFAIRDEEPDIPIPDDNPLGLESTMEYSSEESILSALSLQVYIDIEHPFPTDLQVTLVSPAGTEVSLTPPWRFPTIYGSLDVPENGDFRTLVGENASGTWRLRMVDSVALEEGTLRAWGLRVLNITRGEVNNDRSVDLADGIQILFFLFAGGLLHCEIPADIDDDGTVDITDVVYLLQFLFLGGPAPPPPFEVPGADPTPDGLPCSSS